MLIRKFGDEVRADFAAKAFVVRDIQERANGTVVIKAVHRANGRMMNLCVNRPKVSEPSVNLVDSVILDADVRDVRRIFKVTEFDCARVVLSAVGNVSVEFVEG